MVLSSRIKICFLASGLILAGVNVHAFGLMKAMSEPELRRATLTYAVLKSHEINYCVNNSDLNLFNSSSISIQTKAAINVWLDSAGAIGLLSGNVKISEVKCDDARLNLSIEIGSYHWPNASRANIAVENNHRISHVMLNTAYVENGHRVMDFIHLVPKNMSLDSVIQMISVKNHGNVFDYTKFINPYVNTIWLEKIDGGVNYKTLSFSSYNILIHEVGHAFGFCDTDKNGFERTCDVSMSSSNSYETQPESIMKTGSFYYATADDIEGLKYLFKFIRTTTE